MKTAYAGLRKSTQISGKKHQYYENVIQKIVNTLSQVRTEFIQYKRRIMSIGVRHSGRPCAMR